ncbi:MAG TPA: DUF899 family protein [Acidobacteriaceae bacterium]|nr:DUF899 family protein [Acidobacteriaceae bacterium]
MATESNKVRLAAAHALQGAPLPAVVGREEFEERLQRLRLREKEHTHQGDAIAADRRRLPAVEVSPTTTLTGPDGPVTLLDAFEGRRQLIAYYFMWQKGRPAQDQCQGCTWVGAQIGDLSYFHARDVTFAVFAQGPYPESVRYRDFMGWQMPWYSAMGSLETLLAGRRIGCMHLVCYLRSGSRVLETYWTTARGVEVTDSTYHLLDLTVYGRQEQHEDSPQGWPQAYSAGQLTIDGRPLSQWSRIEAGRSDDLTGEE